MVISEELAEKYFGKAEPIGKILKVNDKPFEVTGVLQNLPYNSHLSLNLITALSNLEPEAWYKKDVADNWHSTMFYTYIKVKENINVSVFEKQVKSAANKYVSKELKEWGSDYHFFLQPVKDIHLHSQLKDEAEVPGNATNVNILLAVAVLIIIIASLNYINLTTVQSANRAKEVGVRKVIGTSVTSIVGLMSKDLVKLVIFAFLIATPLSYVLISKWLENFASRIAIGWIISKCPASSSQEKVLAITLLRGNIIFGL